MSSLPRPTNTLTDSGETAASKSPLSLVDTESVQLLDQLISQCARENSNAPAVIVGSEVLSYGDLERQSNQLAHHLRSVGVGPDVLVGLCMERSASLVLAALAILKAGGAYLPLDPAYPADRLLFMLRDSGVRKLIARDSVSRQLAAHGCEVIDLEKITNVLAQMPGTIPEVLHSSQSLAYVIYTSGSDGQPKGVQITHAGLLNLIHWHNRTFDVTTSDRASQLASISFDAAAWELWPYLSVGASVMLCDEMTRLTAHSLRGWLLQSQITIGFVPTALAERLMGMDWPLDSPLRIMLTGADTLHRRPPSTLPFKVVNNYGPTECTVVATSGPVLPADQNGSNLGQPTIGRAIDNVQIHILDEAGSQVAAGLVGEIAIGGAGLASGYVNRPDLNAKQFVRNPFVPGERLYRTGDLGRQLPNGEIEFLGRLDQQIKVRGFRVEPDEIVNALNRHPGVQASVVIARDDASSSKQLIAYVVAVDGIQLSHGSLLATCSETLPEFMRPTMFVLLDELPLNHNGKVDRMALPAPDAANIIHDQARREPRTPLEARVVALLAELLGVPSVGAEDNFFFLGGHSLLGTQLITRLRETFGVELTLRRIFDSPTAAELAVELESRGAIATTRAS
jgi:amino acid adenylation domain-containing protein